MHSRIKSNTQQINQAHKTQELTWFTQPIWAMSTQHRHRQFFINQTGDYINNQILQTLTLIANNPNGCLLYSKENLTTSLTHSHQI